MNEGKPAKAKWWNRPQEESAPPGQEASVSGQEVSAAEARLSSEEGVASAEVVAGADGDGDFELPPPVTVPGASDGSGAPGVPEAAPAAQPDLPPEPPQSGPPQPLHDPDPYSTPPYGHPGPWAPAPPVQHPAMTPAHGTAVPGPLTPPGLSEVPEDVSDVPEAPAPPPAPPETGSGPNPWQRYDPWSASPLQSLQPLQQNGSAPVDARPGARKRGLVVGAVLIALLSGGVGGAVGSYLERHGGGGERIQLPQTASDESVGRAPDSVAGIAARALPSVVTLHVRGDEAEGTGTGFVLDGRGHILTNNHVVEPAGADGAITVTFSGGETAEAEVVGRDSGYDLAVVKVSDVDGLQPVVLGNSDNVAVGDPVVAIGAPFDLANTVTSGIISAKERPITAGGESGDGSDVSYVDALQTDAPINPGNSGGPLLDARARVVGINSAIRSADSGSGLDGAQSGSIGLGFAIPINQGKRVAEELINTGKATHPVIGVTLDMDYSGDGARVGTEGNDGGPAVTTGGPGDRAGLEAGDIITEVDDRRVHSGEELIVKIRAHRPGDRLELSLLRGGRERTISLVLGSSGGN
ncbi:trypsin-like peptidase domain-containing protein [Streptomyces sp. GQFP]|uniref:trypsin-like peptidase domain-containing protein n=1 Tax=Streptomyces sp. GQFP TaxID=2907545 RepID=UPI001F2073BD|nr:trypsin-like peptidase domain-containing protein [Streptomyces sp. GQFP]UIX30963.1 trypsin-like peptidase domain-containing protein [Streptomyces sp. GQFP]